MKDAYTEAFRRTNALYYNQQLDIDIKKDIEINLVQIIDTGDLSPDASKKILQLRYYIVSENQVVSSEYAADSINLLSDQEMARYLNQDIQNQGFVELKPRQNVETDKKLWIIAAVLGPILIFILLLWIILFVYYKCINPRPNKKKAITKENEETKESKSLSDESLVKLDDNSNQALMTKSAKVKPLNESPPEPIDDDQMLINDSNKVKKKSKDNVKLPDLNQNKIVPSPNFIKFEDDNSSDYQIEDSIRQKSEAEKWRKLIYLLKDQKLFFYFINMDLVSFKHDF